MNMTDPRSLQKNRKRQYTQAAGTESLKINLTHSRHACMDNTHKINRPADIYIVSEIRSKEKPTIYIALHDMINMKTCGREGILEGHTKISQYISQYHRLDIQKQISLNLTLWTIGYVVPTFIDCIDSPTWMKLKIDYT